MKQEYTLPNGEVVTILIDEDIKKNDYYVNLKSGFMGYCLDDADASAMNLVRHILSKYDDLIKNNLSVNREEDLSLLFEDDLKGLWVKMLPTDIQSKKIKNQYK